MEILLISVLVALFEADKISKIFRKYFPKLNHVFIRDQY